MDIADQLLRLAELRDRGLLTAEEFDTQRRALLARGSRPPDAPVGAASGVVIGAYDLIEVVGEGGMGVVYRGRHRVAGIAARQGGDVAIKLVHTHLASRPDLVDRLRREADALAVLDHPNIVKIHDVIEEAGRLALVMEWVPGRPLSQVIGRETGPIPWERAQDIVRPILDAVAHAHERGVIHRDLKPENILVRSDGVLKVVDFGLARLGDGRDRTKTGTGMGTVDYMAPEQYADARAVDQRADVYALGMTLYEIVAGRLPWDPTETEFGVLQRKHAGQLPPPTDFYPSIPPWVVEAISAALVADPTRRLANVGALSAALFRRPAHPAAAATPAPSPAPSVAPPPAAPVAEAGARSSGATKVAAGFGLAILFAVALVGVVVVGGVALWMQRRHDAACERLVALAGDLYEQKTVVKRNTMGTLDDILARGRTDLEFCPEEPRGRAVVALGTLWREGWQNYGAHPEPSRVIEVATSAATLMQDSRVPEAMTARVVIASAKCRFLSGPVRDTSCAELSRVTSEALAGIPADTGGWLRVEAAWPAAMAALDDSSARFAAGDAAGAQISAAAGMLTCDAGLPHIGAAPVNGVEMAETCLQIAGYTGDISAYYRVADAYLTALESAGKSIDKRVGKKLVSSLSPRCDSDWSADDDGLPRVSRRGFSGSWLDYCRVVAARAAGCLDTRSMLYTQKECSYDPFLGLTCPDVLVAQPGVPMAAVHSASMIRTTCAL